MKQLFGLALGAMIILITACPSIAQNDALFIAPSGKVGIGTTNPVYNLTVTGSDVTNAFGVDNKAVFFAKNAAQQYEAYLWPRWDDNKMYLNYGQNGFVIRTQNSSIVAITMSPSGNVCIGSDNAKSKLEVNGRIRDQAGYVTPVGAIVAYGGSTPPDGWLLCDGQATDRYPDLRAVVGNNIPDLRGRFIVGTMLSSRGKDYENYPLGKTGGESFHTIKVEEMPAHSHRILANGSGGSGVGGGRSLDLFGGNYANNNNSGNSFVEPAGGGQAFENKPPYYALTYIIKY